MEDCIFCKIVNQELPAEIIYQDDEVLAFHDKYPQAPTHILVIPKVHLSTLWDVDPENKELLSSVFKAIDHLSKEFDPDKRGFRVVNNCGKMGLQSVYHVHFHFLTGRYMKWPPG